MKIKNIFYCLVSLIFLSCNNDENSSGGGPLNPQQNISLRAGTADATVLFFSEANNAFAYDKTVTVNISTIVNLNYGNYKCLFYKYAGDLIQMVPATVSAANTIEDINFNAINDANMGGTYVLPVNELWLPENLADANLIYNIPNVTLIENTLARAVSQVLVHIYKVSEDGDTIPIVSSPGDAPINLGELTLDISGVSTSWDITGPSGNGNTFFRTEQAIANADGSITFNGPFVFPSQVNQTSVDLTFNTVDDSILPTISERTIKGPLDRNKKLEITLLLKEGIPVEGNLEIEVDVIEMEDNAAGGDNGIWE